MAWPCRTELWGERMAAALAPRQVEAHGRKLGEYEAIRDSMPESVPEGPRATGREGRQT
jgi:hypothetical protein